MTFEKLSAAACEAAHGRDGPHERRLAAAVRQDMTYAVLLRIDAGGEWPVVAGPETDLHADSESGVRWRLVAQTDDEAEAYRLHALLCEQRQRDRTY
jgi:hypothetical protein